MSPLQALKDLKGRTEAIPCVVGDEEVWTSDVRYQVSVSPVGGGAQFLPEPGVPSLGQQITRDSLPAEFIVGSLILNSVRQYKTSKNSLGGLVMKDADFTPVKRELKR